MESDLITTTEAAAELNVTPGRVRQLVAEKRLPTTWLGGRTLISRRDLQLVGDRRRTGRPPARRKNKKKS